MNFRVNLGLQDVSIFGTELMETEVDIEVQFRIQIYYRPFRIDHIQIDIEKIFGTVQLEDEDGKPEIIQLDESEDSKDWKVINELYFKPDGALIVQSLEIDLKSKVLTLT